MFGSLCYGYQHHIHKKKWDPRALPGVFIGYDPKSPAKLVYFPNENKIRKVKDVKFTDQLFYGPDTSANTANESHITSGNPDPTHFPPIDFKPEARVDSSTRCTRSSGQGHLKRYPKRVKSKTKFFGVDENDESDDEYIYETTSVSNIYNIFALSNVHSIYTPSTYLEAINSNECDQWIQAMEQEMRVLVAKGTFKLVKLPPGQKAIGVRWVYAVKIDPTGQIIFKARCVAKGFSQKPGIHFEATFAPTM